MRRPRRCAEDRRHAGEHGLSDFHCLHIGCQWHVQSGLSLFKEGGTYGAAADGRGRDIVSRIWAPLSVQTTEGAAGSRVAAVASGVLGFLFCAVHATSLVGTVNVKPGVTFAA